MASNSIKLSKDQIEITTQLNSGVLAKKVELAAAEEKLNLFVSGILTTKGLSGPISYEVKNDELIITSTLPEVPHPEPIEE